jgi:glycosyltransferase involved in cell wall biosynthesis
MNNFKKLSIIIPAWKFRGYIQEAIDSLSKQTNKDFELIIVSDSNKDKYEALKEDFIKQIYLSEEKHPALKINIGFAESKGKYITVLSDDDLLDETFVEKMTQKMDEGFDVVYSDMQVFGEREYLCPASDEWTLNQFKISTVPYITSMVTREMFKQVGGYSVANYYDWDFWWKCFENKASHFHLKEPLFKYRCTKDNITSFSQNPDFKREILNKHL